MKTLNIMSEVEKLIEPFLHMLCAKSYVQGVVLLGGLGTRQFMDKFSDIDIAVFTLREDATHFPLPFEFHYRVNERVLEFNIHQLIIEDEEVTAKWGHGKVEAYSRSRILYDPTGKILRLIEGKTVFDKDEAFQRLLWIAHQYQWRGQIHSLRAYQRGHPEAAHDLLNQCAELLLEAVFLLLNSYPPHRKWGLVYLKGMESPFGDLHNSFMNALLVKGFELCEIQRRIQVLNHIFSVVMTEVRQRYPDIPEDVYTYYYRKYVQLNKRTTVDDILIECQNELTENELSDLKGILCFNLIESSTELTRLISVGLATNITLKEKLLRFLHSRADN